MSLEFDARGEAVSALHEALAANGQTIAPDEIKEQRFGDSTRQAIIALQKKAGLPPSGVVDSATAQTIAAVGTAAGRGQPFVVRGQVRRGDGTPLARVTVRAFDRDLRHEQPLGEATTDETGWYVISYTPTKFCRSPRGDSDLIVRAYGDKNTVLQTSPVVFNAPNPATINLVVGAVVPSGPSEFEQIARCLTPLLDGVAPADITRADIVMLLGESGLDQLAIAYYVIALRLANQTDLPAALFFGLAREGIAPALPAILAAPLEESRAALVRALADNIIPQALAKDLDSIIVHMRTLRSDPVRLPIGKVLATTLPDLASQSRLIDQFASSTQEPLAIWKSLESDAAFGPDKVKPAQLALQLAAVTLGHAPLVAALLKQKQVANARDLAKLSRADWAALIQTTGAPDVVPGADAATKAANYANTLVRVVEDAFPTAAFAHNLRAS